MFVAVVSLLLLVVPHLQSNPLRRIRKDAYKRSISVGDSDFVSTRKASFDAPDGPRHPMLAIATVGGDPNPAPPALTARKYGRPPRPKEQGITEGRGGRRSSTSARIRTPAEIRGPRHDDGLPSAADIDDEEGVAAAGAVLAFVRNRGPNASSRHYTGAFERVRGNKHACEQLLQQFRHQTAVATTTITTTTTTNTTTNTTTTRTTPSQQQHFSSYMAVALIRSYCTDHPADMKRLQPLLEQVYPLSLWHPVVVAAAIRACAVVSAAGGGPATAALVDESTAEVYYHNYSHYSSSSLSSSPKRVPECIVLALLAVYRASRNVQAAEQLVMRQKRQQQQPSSSVSSKIWNALLQVCVEAKDLDTATRLMQNEIIPSNIFHATTYLHCLLALNRHEDAVSYLLQIAKLGPPPDDYAVVTVMKSCSSSSSNNQNDNGFALAQKILHAIKTGQIPIALTEEHYNILLTACTSPAMAKEIIQEMRFSRRHRTGAIPPSMISYTKALVVCRKAKDLTMARSLLTTARNDGLFPDVFMYTTAIWTAAGAQRPKAAVTLLQQMRQSNQGRATIVSYNGVLAALAASSSQRVGGGDGTLAYDLFINCITNSGLQPTFTTYALLVAAIQKEAPSERQRMMTTILCRLEEQEKRSSAVQPLWKELICTCGLTGDFDTARQCIETLGQDVDNSIVLAYSKVCSEAKPPLWNETLSLARSNAAGMSKTMASLVYSHAILSCAKNDRLFEALELAETCFADEELILSLSAVNSLIAACGRGDRPDLALSILYQAEHSKVKLTDKSYCSAIMACARAEHQRRRENSKQGAKQQRDEVGEWWECALSLLRRMTESGLSPNSVALSSAISACEAAGQWKAALRTLQSAMQSGFDNNLYCFNAAIAACEKGGAWVEALDIYERLKDNDRLKPNIVTVGSIVEALDGAGQQELAATILDEAIKSRYLPSPWKLTADLSQHEILALDLHNYSSAMAKAAIRNYFELLFSTAHREAEPKPLVIIVGRGSHNNDTDPVLKSSVYELLVKEYGIYASIDNSNLGRLIVSGSDLQRYVDRGQTEDNV
jgi:pentatricopeptide repeat domain-containing protein 1